MLMFFVIVGAALFLFGGSLVRSGAREQQRWQTWLGVALMFGAFAVVIGGYVMAAMSEAPR